MKTVLFWFRNDLRLHDQPALQAALASGARYLLPVACLPAPDERGAWGWERASPQRRAWRHGALRDLDRQLTRLGCPLLVCDGDPATVLPALAAAVGATELYCEDIAAPEELQQVAALRAAGLAVHTTWQSTLLDPQYLPWTVDALPASYTPFRQAVERATRVAIPAIPATSAAAATSASSATKAPVTAPLAAPSALAPAPLAPPDALLPWPPATTAADPGLPGYRAALLPAHADARTVDARASLPAGLQGGETAALAHLHQYLHRRLPDSYKRTRNQLQGVDFSSKWSPWLANGALSARRIVAELRAYEAQHGANEGTYWLWFELLWRDYFRLLHLQHGAALYRERGLSTRRATPTPDASAERTANLTRWRHGATGQPLVDAAMRELLHTGYLSNRLRQVVASFLLGELQGDWRAGAAWFESRLVDYDVYSNQGNWLYIAGRGTDPRGGRHFNLEKQTAEHDPDGVYRRLWTEGEPA